MRLKNSLNFGVVLILLSFLNGVQITGSQSPPPTCVSPPAGLVDWWPGNGNVYMLGNGQLRSYGLSCLAGENICYGASMNLFVERYWGAGSKHQYNCTNCCYVCGQNAQTGVINLSP